MKINYKNTLLVGLAFFSVSIFWQLYDFYIPLILKNTFHVSDTIQGFIMSADNVVALLLLPLFGMMSDKTHTRIGRRKPYIIFGTLTSAAAMLVIPYAAHAQQLMLFMVGLGFVLLLMATYRSPAVALMPDITPKPLRSKGNAIINLMGALGGGIFLLINIFMAPDTTDAQTANYWPIYLLTAAMMIVAMLIVVLFVNEPKLSQKMQEDSKKMGIDDGEKEDNGKEEKAKLSPDVRRSMILILISIALWFMGYNAVTTAFSKYAVHHLHMTESDASGILMVAVIVATVAFIPVGIISSRIGRKKSIIFGVILLSAVFATATLYTGPTPMMYVSFSLAGVAWAAINVNSLPMVLEMSRNASIGQYTGYYYTFSMAAQVATPILSGVLLQHVGYITLFPYAAIFVGLAIITMLFVRHGDSRPVPPRDALESFDTAD